MTSVGRIAPAALFVYGTSPEAYRTNMVSLNWRNELHKETLRQRVREKAPVEGAYAVVVLNTEDRTLGDVRKDFDERTSHRIGGLCVPRR